MLRYPICIAFIDAKLFAVPEIAALLPRADKDLPVALYARNAFESTPTTLTPPSKVLCPSELYMLLVFAAI